MSANPAAAVSAGPAYRFTLADLVVDLTGVRSEICYALNKAIERRGLGESVVEAMPLFRRELLDAHAALGRLLDRIFLVEAAALPTTNGEAV